MTSAMLRLSCLAALILVAGFSAPGSAITIPRDVTIHGNEAVVSDVRARAGRRGAHAGARRGGRVNVNRANVNRRANVNVNRRANVNVNRRANVNINRRVNVVHRPVRAWTHRPYYGRIVGGVALGTIIAVTAVGVAPVAPAPNMCWFWADSRQRQGYWDYCQMP
jgi:hypothetical protein